MDLICADVQLSDEFYDDYETAPENIQRRITRLITMIARSKKVPPSVNAHKARFLDDKIFIGYVTASRTSWRILFRIDDDVMVILRLMTHKQQDDFMRNWV